MPRASFSVPAMPPIHFRGTPVPCGQPVSLLVRNNALAALAFKAVLEVSRANRRRVGNQMARKEVTS